RQRHLKAVVPGKGSVRNVVDISQVWKLRKERSSFLHGQASAATQAKRPASACVSLLRSRQRVKTVRRTQWRLIDVSKVQEPVPSIADIFNFKRNVGGESVGDADVVIHYVG